MANHTTDVCAFLDRSIPELRGEQVFFTAHSGTTVIHVCMSRHEARKMAAKVLKLLDRDQHHVVGFDGHG